VVCVQAVTIFRAASAFALAVIAFLPNAATSAFVVYLAAAGSDALDGILARRLSVTTQGGAALDIACDKYLTIFSILFLIAAGAPVLPCYMALARDIFVQAFRAVTVHGRPLFPPIRAIGLLVVIPIRFTTGYVLLTRLIGVSSPVVVANLCWICGVTSIIVLVLTVALGRRDLRAAFEPDNG
jgi:phosphatidylglycerophosphate synthase